jgi:hypothetical protein
MTFDFDFVTDMLSKALEANVGTVFVVGGSLMREFGKTVLGNIIGAYDAWFSRDRDFLASWCFVGIIIVEVALTFHSTLRRC